MWHFTSLSQVFGLSKWLWTMATLSLLKSSFEFGPLGQWLHNARPFCALKSFNLYATAHIVGHPGGYPVATWIKKSDCCSYRYSDGALWGNSRSSPSTRELP
ncbi:MAG: hypothetical protein BYD32DRAFT_441809 [Podila humilis]|nr:MAG: hypothetical protein BYD32DRAFT_441809 [Podila humilis]